MKTSVSAVAGVTILLSLTVFMNMVQNIMPSTSDAVPLIGGLPQAELWSVVVPNPQCVAPLHHMLYLNVSHNYVFIQISLAE
jgi:hypothetical protein